MPTSNYCLIISDVLVYQLLWQITDLSFAFIHKTSDPFKNKTKKYILNLINQRKDSINMKLLPKMKALKISWNWARLNVQQLSSEFPRDKIAFQSVKMLPTESLFSYQYTLWHNYQCCKWSDACWNTFAHCTSSGYIKEEYSMLTFTQTWLGYKGLIVGSVNCCVAL